MCQKEFSNAGFKKLYFNKHNQIKEHKITMLVKEYFTNLISSLLLKGRKNNTYRKDTKMTLLQHWIKKKSTYLKMCMFYVITKVSSLTLSTRQNLKKEKKSAEVSKYTSDKCHLKNAVKF